MALDKDALTSVMVAATKSCPAGGDAAMIALGKAIENYLIANTDAVYAWSGKDPATSAPDPDTTFNAVVSASGSDFVSKPSDFDKWVRDLEAFLNKIKIDPASGWSLGSLAKTSGKIDIKQLLNFPSATDGELVMNSAFYLIADGVIDGWPSYFVTSADGSHSKFLGSASLNGVS